MNPPPTAGRVFSSWKEIATYLGKGVRTVQRWEKSMGLPISRPQGAASNVIVTTETALREWIQNGKPAGNGNGDLPAPVEAQNRIVELQQRLERLERENLRLLDCLTELQQRFDQLHRTVAPVIPALLGDKAKEDGTAPKTRRVNRS